jgi:hypothetical protein
MKIFRIAGTVLDRDKAKKTVTLLTTDGVVTVKVFGQVFAHYDKLISERGADGKKHVIEKSIFNRGNKIIVSSKKVEKPARVRYGWEAYSTGNLVNQFALPASTFEVVVK